MENTVSSPEVWRMTVAFEGLSTEFARNEHAGRLEKVGAGTEYRVPSTEYRVPSAEYRVRSTECGVSSTEYRLWISMSSFKRWARKGWRVPNVKLGFSIAICHQTKGNQHFGFHCHAVSQPTLYCTLKTAHRKPKTENSRTKRAARLPREARLKSFRSTDPSIPATYFLSLFFKPARSSNDSLRISSI